MRNGSRNDTFADSRVTDAARPSDLDICAIYAEIGGSRGGDIQWELGGQPVPVGSGNIPLQWLIPTGQATTRVPTLPVCDARSQTKKKELEMNVRMILIQRASKPPRLAEAIVELSDSNGDTLVISDIRILQNKQGQAWVAMPSRSVSDGGRSFQYSPLVESSRQLQRKIEDCVLTAFEEWQRSQAVAGVRS